MSDSLITDQQVTEPQIDENKTYLPELVGEGKKFKDIESLAKGKAYSDAMIEFQNKQMDALRQDYMKLREEHMAGTSLQELIDQMKSSQQPGNHTPPLVNPEERPVFNPDELDSLVSKKIIERETSQRQDNNFKQVRDKLIERYGTNHTSVLKKQIDDLGMSVQEADQMARSNPRLFERTFGLDRTSTDPNYDHRLPSNGPRPTDPFAPSAPSRDYQYYRTMRKQNPDLYWSPKTQTQMHNDALRNPDAFEE